MVNKESEDYLEGFKAGISFSCNHIVDVAHRFKRDIFELAKLKTKYR